MGRFKLLILLALGFALIGCQSKNKVNSFGPNTNDNPSTGSSTSLDCTPFQGPNLRGRLEADPQSQDYVFLKFNSVPTQFTASGTTPEIRFYAGSDTNSTGATSVAFVVYSSVTLTPISGYINVNTPITQTFLNSLNNNNLLQLNQVTFHLNVGPLSRALRIRMSQGSTDFDNFFALIPSYAANPNDYATNHSQSLLNIHPLLSYSSNNWTDDQFKTQGDYLCSLP